MSKTNLKFTDADTFKIGSDNTDYLNDDGTAQNSQGGTENMYRGLKERLDPDLLDNFHIICSRVRKIDPDRHNILWLHDTWDDPESQHLKEESSRKRFEQLVFVSNYQQQTYNMALKVPYADGLVIGNAIEPIQLIQKKDFSGPIKLIYHTTPHRGLELLVPVVNQIIEQTGLDIHLDVFSSFGIYGWEGRDEPYKELFQRIEDHPNMTYHGWQPNDVVREALKEAHIYAYPNIWPETSCISALEAMSAGCAIVCPNYAALPETVTQYGMIYPFHESYQRHAEIFANTLYGTITHIKEIQQRLAVQKNYVDNFYNWDLRAEQWTGMLEGILKRNA